MRTNSFLRSRLNIFYTSYLADSLNLTFKNAISPVKNVNESVYIGKYWGSFFTSLAAWSIKLQKKSSKLNTKEIFKMC